MTEYPPPGLALWLGLGHLAAPLARPLLRRRLARGKEDAARLPERLGHPGRARPPGPLVWLHGASVGEATSLVPLVERLLTAREPPVVLVTSGTVTSAARLAALLPEGAIHQFAPVDTAPAVRRFLAHWRPALGVFVESELWPGLLWRAARADVALMLVGARLSARSARSWTRRAPATARALVRLFETIDAQDAASAERFRALGADPGRVRVGGNLKRLVPPPGCDAAELAGLRARLAGRPVWLAASTHESEEAVVLDAHRRLAAVRPGLVTFLAPRHPERGDRVAALVEDAGLPLARRSRGEPPPEGGVWLVDTLGEMGLLYRLAPAAFVGGSLVPKGGHNPFEPTALGAAVLAGPETANFAPAYAALAEAGALRTVTDAAGLAGGVAALIGPDGTPTPVQGAMVAAARAAFERDRPDADALVAEMLALAGLERAGRG